MELSCNIWSLYGLKNEAIQIRLTYESLTTEVTGINNHV